MDCAMCHMNFVLMKRNKENKIKDLLLYLHRLTYLTAKVM